MVKKLIFICIIFFLGCVGVKKDNDKTFFVCGTYLRISSEDSRAADIVYDEFKRLEKIFNKYDSKSELSSLNNSYNSSVKVSSDLLQLLLISFHVYDVSGGAFDVSQGVLYDFWKDLIKSGSVDILPDQDKVKELMAYGGMANIVIDKENSTVTIKKRGLKIDLGGIADGYMVDSAVNKLREAGINSALIDVGGDIFCLGINNGRPWRVGVRNPEDIQGIIDQQDMQDEAIATSGNYEQYFDIGSKRYSHIIDPRTGYPVTNNVTSVTVITKNCTSADSLSTYFYVIGEDGVAGFLSKNLSTMRVFMLIKNGDKTRIRIF